MLSEKDAKALTAKVIGLSTADEVEVHIHDGESSNIRFARNAPTTSGARRGPQITITATFGTRRGSATINQTSDAALAEGVRRAEEIARLAPEDPEHVPALGPQNYAAPAAFDEATAARGHEAMAEGVGACIRSAAERDLVAAGFSRVDAGVECVANKAGLYGFHRATSASVTETARTADGTGSGWAGQASHRIGDLDYASVGSTAADKALASAEPRDIEPGDYPTVLEPAAVADLVELLVWAMDARAADEGRSFFSRSGGGNRLGEKLFPNFVTITSDPSDARGPGRPWGEDGLPQTPRRWIDAGTVRSLATSRYWAKKTGAEPVPRPSNLFMAGGKGDVASLVRNLDRGLLVTRLWYIRSVDPQTLLYTGITRDGVFWVEGGEVKHPVKNLRWNESPVAVLQRAQIMSQPVRVPSRRPVVVPGLKLKRFGFTSVSDAV